MRRALALLAAIAFTGCDERAPLRTPPPDEPPASTQIPVAADRAGEAPAPEGFIDTDPSPLTREEIIGMWGLRAQCGQPTIFAEDGTFTDYTGQTGEWSLQGDALTMTRAGRTYTSEVNQLNTSAFTSGPPDDGSGRTRLFVVYQHC